jgi:hypothetical protein
VPTREGAAPEEGASDVGSAAAGAGDDAPWRPLERRVPAVDDAGRDEDGECVLAALHVELIAGLALERATPVGPDLRPDPLLAEERERAAGSSSAAEVQVERPLAMATEVEAACGVEERRELGPAVALARRRDPRQLPAHVF